LWWLAGRHVGGHNSSRQVGGRGLGACDLRGLAGTLGCDLHCPPPLLCEDLTELVQVSVVVSVTLTIIMPEYVQSYFRLSYLLYQSNFQTYFYHKIAGHNNQFERY